MSSITSEQPKGFWQTIGQGYAARRESWNIFFVLIAAIIIFAFVVAARGNVSTFSSTMFSGILRAMLLFLVAAGLSLIFGLMDILNFAQGAFFMVGAYVTHDFHHPAEGVIRFGDAIPDPNLRFVVGVILGVLAGGLLGVFLERVMLRPLYDRPLFQLVLTFGVSIVMLEAIKFIWTTTPYQWKIPIALQDISFTFAGTTFSLYRIFIIFMGVLLIFGIALLLRRTRIGIIIRAGVEDAEMVSALGINVRAVFTLVFALGCAVAALGGGVAVPFLGATIGMGATYLVASIAVIVLGGLGSYEGTAVASILVGLAWATMEQFSVRPEVASVWASVTPMLLLALGLLLRPNGLFGEER
ncbi:MAG: branched-chain amino acid ABC transporter permease [Chloroflexota bacterium]